MAPFRSNPTSNMYPPSSGRHAMRSLYGIGRDGWVWDMSITHWLDMDSSHGVGECSVTVVWHRAGVYSDRPCHEIIVAVIAVVAVVAIVALEQTIYSIYNIIVGGGCLRMSLSPR